MKRHYHKTKLPDGTTRDTHRLLMERQLGRPLTRLEHVHHINGDRYDNRIENLMVMAASEHGRLHAKGQPYRGRSKEGAAKIRAAISGEARGGTKLCDVSVMLAIEARRAGVGVAEIAKTFGVSTPYMYRILTGRKWVFTKLPDPRGNVQANAP